MTYRNLLKVLLDLPKENLDDTATVYAKNEDEFFPIEEAKFADEKQDILDVGHMFLEINL
jgi:hypothetical protein